MPQFATPEAAVMLKLETPRHPMHLASLQVFEPPADAGPDFVEQIFAGMRACTDVAPVFTGHPRDTRRGGTSAVRWFYDSKIDLDDHLELRWLPSPDDSAFFDVLSELHSGLLDRTKPLWRATVIGGLEGGRFAVYIKTHHALIDGVSGMRMLRQSLSTDPDDREVRASWTQQPASPPAITAPPEPRRSMSTRAAGTAKAARRSASSIRAALRERELFPVFRAPRTLLNASAGGARRVAVLAWPAARIADVAKTANVSPNDVSVAMIAGALRRYLSERGALPDTPMLGMLPVSMRTGAEANERNIFGSAVCNLATHLDDPAERLRVIGESMDYNKRFIRSLPKQVAIHLAGVICAPVVSGRIPPVFNVSISQVPAPRETLYRGGARLLETYALAPTLSGQALNFGLISDGEKVTFSVVGNTVTVPDLERFLDLFENALKDLEHAVGQ